MEIIFYDVKNNPVILDVGNSWSLIINHAGSWKNQTLGALNANNGNLFRETVQGKSTLNSRLVGDAWIGDQKERIFQFDYFFDGTFSYYVRGTGTLFQVAVRKQMVPGRVGWRTV